MVKKYSDSFIRWQTVTREHFTSTSNIVLGLSTGLLAFSSEHLLQNGVSGFVLLWIGVGGLLALVGSISSGIWCSITRLKDFRSTAQIARCRDLGETISEEKRLETKILGKRSWCLFNFQLIFFGIGSITTALALLLKSWG